MLLLSFVLLLAAPVRSSAAETTIRDVSGDPPTIPADAVTTTETTAFTDAATGDVTTTTVTTTSWDGTTAQAGEFGPAEIATTSTETAPGVTVTITTETREKTDTATRVEGHQQRTDTRVTDADGRCVRSSFVLDGTQTTATATTVTTATAQIEKTTDASAPPVTTRRETLSNPVNDGEAQSTEYTTEPETIAATAPQTEQETLPARATQQEIPAVTLCFSAAQPTATQTVTPAALDPLTAAEQAQLLRLLAGWQILKEEGDAGAAVLGTVQADGTVMDESGKTVDYAPDFTRQADGSYTATVRTAPQYGALTVEGTTLTGPTRGESTVTPGETTTDRREETTRNEDGNTEIETTITTATATRTDTTRWMDTTSRTEALRQTRADRTLTLRIALANAGRTVTGSWNGVLPGTGDGLFALRTPTPTLAKFALEAAWQSHLGVVHTPPAVSDGGATGNALQYDGYGLTSTVLIGYWVTAADGSRKFSRTSYVHQFRLRDAAGHAHYAYCADLATNAQPGALYEPVNITDADYYSAEAAAHLQAIVENGYWGTESGMGSLDAVRALVSEDTRAALDDGLALAATQAAIWHFGDKSAAVRELGGNSMNTGIPNEQIFEYYFKNAGLDVAALSGAQRAAALELYNALLALDPAANTAPVTDLVTDEDLRGACVTVDAATNGGYHAALAFTLAAEPAHLNGELYASVYVGDDPTPLLTQRLATAEGEADAAPFARNADGTVTYTLAGLILPADTDITLRLTGTQRLAAGAYLYRADSAYETSQTLIGLVEEGSTRAVELSTALRFAVSEAMQQASGSATQTGATLAWEKVTTTEQPRKSTMTVTEQTVSTVSVATRRTESERTETTDDTVTLVWHDSGEAAPGNVPETGDTGPLWLGTALAAGAALMGAYRASRRRKRYHRYNNS
jgi:TQXA domain-containing protein